MSVKDLLSRFSASHFATVYYPTTHATPVKKLQLCTTLNNKPTQMCIFFWKLNRNEESSQF